jgi:hypothetical protein
MDGQLQAIFDSTPEDEPRSRLQPYCDLILLWRRQGRSYRRIQRLLDEKCNVTIAYEPLRRFVQRRSRPRKKRDDKPSLKQNPSKPVEQVEPSQQREVLVTPPVPLPAPERQSKVDRWAADRERMKRDKAQPVVDRKPEWKVFEYDEDSANEPLY